MDRPRHGKSDSRVYDEYGFDRSEMSFNPDQHQAFLEHYLPVLVRRGQKWDRLTSSDYDGVERRGRRLKRYVRKGVPAEHRGNVWMIVSGAEEMRNERPTLYAEALEISRGLRELDLSEISNDLHRTFPTNAFFETDAPHSLLPSLHNVLAAFAAAHPHVGYCQGMNFVAGLLLVVTRDECKTFWLLAVLIERILPEFYGPNVPGLITEIKLFAHLIKVKYPKVHLAAERHRLPWELVCSKWFVCLFSDVLPVETTLRVWDCLFYEGSKIVLRVAIALVAINEHNIVKANDMAGLVDVFRNAANNDIVLNCHTFMERVFELSGPLMSSSVARLRNELGAEVVEQLQQRERRRIQYQQAKSNQT